LDDIIYKWLKVKVESWNLEILEFPGFTGFGVIGILEFPEFLRRSEFGIPGIFGIIGIFEIPGIFVIPNFCNSL